LPSPPPSGTIGGCPGAIPASTSRSSPRPLAGNARARRYFATLSPSGRREYVEWLTEVKWAETRQRRMQTAVGWMAEGKPRHWKYRRRP